MAAKATAGVLELDVASLWLVSAHDTRRGGPGVGFRWTADPALGLVACSKEPPLSGTSTSAPLTFGTAGDGPPAELLDGLCDGVGFTFGFAFAFGRSSPGGAASAEVGPIGVGLLIGLGNLCSSCVDPRCCC